MRSSSPSLLFGVLLGLGCAHPSRAYVAAVPVAPGAAAEVGAIGGALDVLARALARDGHRVGALDRKSGEITTLWEDTGYRYRETDDLEDETSVFLRFHVRTVEVGAERQVWVSADSERCVPYRAALTSTGVGSTCLHMHGVLPSHQKVVEALGRRLSAVLGPTGARRPGS
ncbi:MAG TPA: hypothetical protein VKO16_03785 [Polyangia bacterium]|jgi:hypothetical protein|nr:hypothetical protein [Polyangia bacterium]